MINWLFAFKKELNIETIERKKTFGANIITSLQVITNLSP